MVASTALSNFQALDQRLLESKVSKKKQLYNRQSHLTQAEFHTLPAHNGRWANPLSGCTPYSKAYALSYPSR